MLQPGRSGNSGRFKDDLLNTGATPLLRAAQTFDDDVVRALLEHRALVDLPNAMGVTPLMAAAGIGTRTTAGVLGPGPPEDFEARSMKNMEILLKAGANVNASITDTMTRREGQTALFFAVQIGRKNVVRFLLGIEFIKQAKAALPIWTPQQQIPVSLKTHFASIHRRIT